MSKNFSLSPILEAPIGNRILIVDDSKSDQEIIKHTLNRILKPDHTFIFFANNLTEAKALLVQMKFDLIFIDVYIGPDDGILFLAEIRASELPIIKDTPVVLVSGLPRDIDILAAKQLNVEGFIQKTPTMNEYENVVRQVLPKSLLE